MKGLAANYAHRHKKTMTLSQLKTGESGQVGSLFIGGAMRRRLQDIGLVRGAFVRCIGCSPLGDPSAYLIKGALVAIRKKEAECIRLLDTSPGSDSENPPAL